METKDTCRGILDGKGKGDAGGTRKEEARRKVERDDTGVNQRS